MFRRLQLNNTISNKSQTQKFPKIKEYCQINNRFLNLCIYFNAIIYLYSNIINNVQQEKKFSKNEIRNSTLIEADRIYLRTVDVQSFIR